VLAMVIWRSAFGQWQAGRASGGHQGCALRSHTYAFGSACHNASLRASLALSSELLDVLTASCICLCTRSPQSHSAQSTVNSELCMEQCVSVATFVPLPHDTQSHSHVSQDRSAPQQVHRAHATLGPSSPDASTPSIRRRVTAARHKIHHTCHTPAPAPPPMHAAGGRPAATRATRAGAWTHINSKSSQVK